MSVKFLLITWLIIIHDMRSSSFICLILLTWVFCSEKKNVFCSEKKCQVDLFADIEI